MNVKILDNPFKIGTTVWVRSTILVENLKVLPVKQVDSTEVHGYTTQVFKDADGSLKAVVKSYRLQRAFLGKERNDFEWPIERVYGSEKEAKKDSKVTIIDVGEYNWAALIGIDAVGEIIPSRVEGCELQPCCANISYVRELLAKGYCQGGLEQYDIDEITNSLAGHFGLDKSPNLCRLFAELGIEVPKDEDD